MSNARDIHVAYHESAHATAAFLFGRRVTAVSIVPGVHFGGITLLASRRAPSLSEREQGRLAVPLPMALPARVRRDLEANAMVSLAGPVIDDIIRPRETAYITEAAPASDDEALDQVPPPPTTRIAAALANADATPTQNDMTSASSAAHVLSPRSSVHALAWLREETKAMVSMRSFGKALDILVPVLLKDKVMTGAAAKRLLIEGGIGW
jgi:hypothetical protein